MRPTSFFTKNCRLHVLAGLCLAGGVLGAGPAASAQPDVEGKPDSSAFIRIPSDTDDWTRHFRLGGLVGMNIKAKFSESGAFNLSPNGIYNDGYVRPDQNGDPNYTSYWGYDNRALQYNAANQTLQMHSTTSYSATGSGSADGGPIPGVELAYGGNLWYWKHARVGWEFGFGLLPIDISESQTMPATATQSTFTFSTATLGPAFPTSSSYQGGPGGTGPILSTAYTQTNSAPIGGTDASSQSLKVMLYTARLGPSFYWDLTEHIGMSLGAGPAVGVASGEYKYDDNISIGGIVTPNTGKIEKTDLVYGGYVNAAVMYHAVPNGDFYVGVQFMPMTDARFSGPGREGRLNLDGQVYFSAGINWPF